MTALSGVVVTLPSPGTLCVFSGKKEFSLTLSTLHPSQANSWSINRNYFLIKSEPRVSTLFFASTSTIYHLGDALEINNIITIKGSVYQDLALKIFLSIKAKNISHYLCDQILSKHSPKILDFYRIPVIPSKCWWEEFGIRFLKSFPIRKEK